MLTTLKSGYYLGIDGGGSKTEVVIADESGFVLSRVHGPGINLHNLPLDECWQRLEQTVSQALQLAHKKHPHRTIEVFTAACLGWAGIDTEYDVDRAVKFIKQLPADRQTLGAEKLLLVNDALIALKSGIQQDWGVCLIAGTGSICYAISPSGKEHAAGHWGYLLGDQGSAFAIGQAILKQVMQEYDHRRPASRITRKVLEFWQVASVPELIDKVYSQSSPAVAEIAQLSKLAEDIALSDSVEISQIVDQTVTSLVQAYQAVIHHLDLNKQPQITVVLSGGLFAMKGRFSQMVIRSVLNLTPQANVIFPSYTPAEGAIRIAHLANYAKLLPESAITFVNPKQPSLSSLRSDLRDKQQS